MKSKAVRQFIGSLFLIGLLSNCSNTKTKNEESTKEPATQIVAPIEEGTRIIAEQTAADTLRGSLKAKAIGTNGNTGITINYYFIHLPRKSFRFWTLRRIKIISIGGIRY